MQRTIRDVTSIDDHFTPADIAASLPDHKQLAVGGFGVVLVEEQIIDGVRTLEAHKYVPVGPPIVLGERYSGQREVILKGVDHVHDPTESTYGWIVTHTPDASLVTELTDRVVPFTHAATAETHVYTNLTSRAIPNLRNRHFVGLQFAGERFQGSDIHVTCSKQQIEYIPGVTLTDLINLPEDKLPIGAKMLLAAKVCASYDAEIASHERFVLGDAKPDNTKLYEKDGVVHVAFLDFGSCKPVDGQWRLSPGETPDVLNVLKMPINNYTPGYSSFDDVLSTAIDIYSLGISSATLFLGKHPFSAQINKNNKFFPKEKDIQHLDDRLKEVGLPQIVRDKLRYEVIAFNPADRKLGQFVQVIHQLTADKADLYERMIIDAIKGSKSNDIYAMPTTPRIDEKPPIDLYVPSTVSATPDKQDAIQPVGSEETGYQSVVPRRATEVLPHSQNSGEKSDGYAVIGEPFMLHTKPERKTEVEQRA